MATNEKGLTPLGEIVKTGTTQLIPSSELTGIENALRELEQAARVLPTLKGLVDRYTTIDTPLQYADAGAILAEVRSIKKASAFKMNPFLETLNRCTQFVRGIRSGHEAKCDAIDTILSQKMADFKRREREATQREQDEYNRRLHREAEEKAEADRKAAVAQAEADRKKREAEIKSAVKTRDMGSREAERLKKQAAEEEARAKEQAARDAADTITNVQDVRIQPSVPKVPGLKGRVNWRFKIVDEAKIPRDYMMPDEQRIGAIVRATKNKQTSEALIPGIEVWSDDSI